MDVSKCVSLVLTITLQLNTCLAFSKALERIKLDGHDDFDIDIYVEKRISYLHAKIDLQTTLDGVLSLEKLVYRLDLGPPDSLSRILAKNLDKRLEKIARKLNRVTGQKHAGKTKRSIEFIGDLISNLFGNPGPADWKQLNSNVLALKGAIKRVSENVDIDHADIDKTKHLIERHNIEIRNIVSILNKNKAELNKVDEEIVSLRMYFEILTLAEAVETQIDALVEIKLDTMKGFCNDRAIDKDFLINNLLGLEANKAGLGPVFGSWEWRNYYMFKMCTAALDDKSVWVTLRIPVVKKAEKLVRSIPSPRVHELILRIAGYGLETSLFKEKGNDKFHAISRSNLELCNTLGNTRTCGVRDVKFVTNNNDAVIPVEFALNRFLVVSQVPSNMKVMSKCSNGIAEYTINLDSVWLVPNNCSYTSKYFSIDTREADVGVTKEIGIVHFDKFEFNSVRNDHVNITLKTIAEVFNSSSDSTYAKNRMEIRDQLNQIDTRHSSLLSTYQFEKWLFMGGALLFVGLVVCAKLGLLCWKKKVRVSRIRDGIEMKDMARKANYENIDSNTNLNIPNDSTDQHNQHVHTEHNQQMLDQSQHFLNQKKQLHRQGQNMTTDIAENEKSKGHVYTEIMGSSVSFSSKPELSQFYSK